MHLSHANKHLLLFAKVNLTGTVAVVYFGTFILLLYFICVLGGKFYFAADICTLAEMWHSMDVKAALSLHDSIIK